MHIQDCMYETYMKHNKMFHGCFVILVLVSYFEFATSEVKRFQFRFISVLFRLCVHTITLLVITNNPVFSMLNISFIIWYRGRSHF